MVIKQLQLKKTLNIIVLTATKTIWLLYGHHIVFDVIDRQEKGEHTNKVFTSETLYRI